MVAPWVLWPWWGAGVQMPVPVTFVNWLGVMTGSPGLRLTPGPLKYTIPSCSDCWDLNNQTPSPTLNLGTTRAKELKLSSLRDLGAPWNWAAALHWPLGTQSWSPGAFGSSQSWKPGSWYSLSLQSCSLMLLGPEASTYLDCSLIFFFLMLACTHVVVCVRVCACVCFIGLICFVFKYLHPGNILLRQWLLAVSACGYRSMAWEILHCQNVGCLLYNYKASPLITHA